jgi:hypothetical protein
MRSAGFDVAILVALLGNKEPMDDHEIAAALKLCSDQFARPLTR